MTGCLTVGTAVLHLALGSFTLSWTHSVEHVAWQEDWRINGHMLTLERSRLKGSGAGMEPGPDAVLKDGWWVSTGHLEVPAADAGGLRCDGGWLDVLRGRTMPGHRS